MSTVRRSDLVRPWKSPMPTNPDDLPPDLMSFLSLIFGLMGLLVKMKIFSWLALFALLSALANLKKSEADYKQLMCSITFALMGLYTNYYRVPYVAARYA